MALSLTSLETNVYDAKPHCDNVNSSVLAELGTREAVQKELQKARDTESEASQALATTAHTAYVNTLKSSCGDIMTTASTIPAVIEQNPASVTADNGLAASATAGTSTAQQLQNQTAGNPAAAGASAASSAATPGSAASADEAKKAQESCGVSPDSDPSSISAMFNKATNAVKEYFTGIFKSGKTPEADVTDAEQFEEYMDDRIAMEDMEMEGLQELEREEAEAALRAQQQAAIDTAKAANLALAKQAGSCFADGIIENLKKGTLTPKTLIDNFDANSKALGQAMAGYIGAAVADVPGSNPCSSQAVTNYSLGCASLVNTINGFANKASNMLDLGAKVINQAENIYRHGPETILKLAEKSVQNIANTAAMIAQAGAASNCNIKLAMDVAKGTFSVVGETYHSGLKLANSGLSAADSVAKMINTAQHTDDLVEKGKWLVKKHPLVRGVSNALQSNSTDLKKFDKLIKTGSKFARTTLGAGKQNELSSLSKLTNRAVTSRSLNQLLGYSKGTTSRSSNRYNLYGFNSFSL